MSHWTLGHVDSGILSQKLKQKLSFIQEEDFELFHSFFSLGQEWNLWCLLFQLQHTP